MRSFCVVCLLYLSCALVVTGCGGGAVDADRPKTVPTTATVTYNGSPVANATVAFTTNSPGGRGAVAVTDETGKCSLLTFAPGDGAIPGTYKVTISKAETSADGKISEASESPQEGAESKPASAAKSLLPEKYKSPETSGLTAEVKEGADNNVAFELTD